jgi:hypothetical protein
MIESTYVEPGWVWTTVLTLTESKKDRKHRVHKEERTTHEPHEQSLFLDYKSPLSSPVLRARDPGYHMF